MGHCEATMAREPARSRAAEVTHFFLVPMVWHILNDALVDIVVYARPGHVCCLRWIAHLRAAGYRVHINTKQDVTRIRETYEVPSTLAACHTAVSVGICPAWRADLTFRP
jgi:hypothetical protein